MALAGDELPWRLAWLSAHPLLLPPDPLEPRCREGFDHAQSRGHRRGNGHAPVRRVHPEVDVPDPLPGDGDLQVTEQDQRHDASITASTSNQTQNQESATCN